MGAEVWLVTGAQASGKSTVADLLARRFERAVHVRGGQFERWAVSGWAAYDDPDEVRLRRCLDLRYRLSRQTADAYAAAGFTCVVQDNIYGPDVSAWLGAVAAPVHLVVLRPSVTEVGRRDAERHASTGKIAYTKTFTPAVNDRHLGRTDTALGLWLDTSDQTPEETVTEILRRSDDARVRRSGPLR